MLLKEKDSHRWGRVRGLWEFGVDQRLRNFKGTPPDRAAVLSFPDALEVINTGGRQAIVKLDDIK